MEAGRPVVASRIGGLADLVVDGETGFLVPPGDSEKLGQAIARLLAEPDLRERMGRAAKVRAAEYKASLVVPRIERVYNELLQEHVARQPRRLGAHRAGYQKALPQPVPRRPD